LLKLSQDVTELNASWSHILQTEPNEIREANISAFNILPFWQAARGSKITGNFGARDEKDSKYLCIASRLSTTGDKIGIVRLYVLPSIIQLMVYFGIWTTKPVEKQEEI
jgi:hypothetical protein